MSEGYTIGGDASIKIEEDIRCFQTFTPTYTHTIAYLDLDCSLCAFYRRPTILITTTDEEGKPTDNIITKACYTRLLSTSHARAQGNTFGGSMTPPELPMMAV